MNTVQLNFDNAKVKIEERTKGRMKITFKLGKDEAEAFKNFSMIKPDEVADEVFFKHIFFTGIRTLNEEIRVMFEENKAKLEAQKVSVEDVTPSTDTIPETTNG